MYEVASSDSHSVIVGEDTPTSLDRLDALNSVPTREANKRMNLSNDSKFFNLSKSLKSLSTYVL